MVVPELLLKKQIKRGEHMGTCNHFNSELFCTYIQPVCMDDMQCEVTSAPWHLSSGEDLAIMKLRLLCRETLTSQQNSSFLPLNERWFHICQLWRRDLHLFLAG